jgi:SepF-like predicted cell division protein (DUF552 family)
MAFLEKVFKQQDEVDVEEFLNNLDVQEESMYEDADALVKPLMLTKDQDVEMVLNELKQGNFVLLNIADMSKRNQVKLKELISAIRARVEGINGDIARVSPEKVLITPAKIKIVKKRGA